MAVLRGASANYPHHGCGRRPWRAAEIQDMQTCRQADGRASAGAAAVCLRGRSYAGCSSCAGHTDGAVPLVFPQPAQPRLAVSTRPRRRSSTTSRNLVLSAASPLAFFCLLDSTVSGPFRRTPSRGSASSNGAAQLQRPWVGYPSMHLRGGLCGYTEPASGRTGGAVCTNQRRGGVA